MRFTARVAAGGDEVTVSLPHLPDGCNCFTSPETRRFDEAAARSFLGREAWCRIDADDDRNSLAVGVELISRIQEAFGRQVAAHPGELKKVSDDPHRKTASEWRLAKGRCAVVSVAVRRRGPVFRVKVGWANKSGAVGAAVVDSAESFASAFAMLAIALEEDFRRESCAVRFDLVDGDNCAGMFAAERVRLAAATLRATYERCERRRNGFCSPCKFDCPYYAQGRCKWR